MIKILYEDNHLLVVEKPINIPVQSDISGDDNLLDNPEVWGYKVS